MSEFVSVMQTIQIELGSDFVAAYIITPGGDILAKLSEIPSHETRWSKVNLAAVLRLVDCLDADLHAGPLEEVLITVARGYILIISLQGNAGYLCLVVRRKEALDLTKLLVKEFASELASLIKSE